MDELDVKLQRLLKDGLSLRKAAKEADAAYSTCRARAIKLGLYKPELKGEINGFTVCKFCKKKSKVDNFPNLAYGNYSCRDCLNESNHKYQIAKVGCTSEKYQELMELQSNRCAICESDFGHTTKDGRKAKLAVDHDHKTGKIRGLLCGSCNRGLGYLKEENLHRALVYCEKC